MGVLLKLSCSTLRAVQYHAIKETTNGMSGKWSASQAQKSGDNLLLMERAKSVLPQAYIGNGCTPIIEEATLVWWMTIKMAAKATFFARLCKGKKSISKRNAHLIPIFLWYPWGRRAKDSHGRLCKCFHAF